MLNDGTNFDNFEAEFNQFNVNVSSLISAKLKSLYNDVAGHIKSHFPSFIDEHNLLGFLVYELKFYNDFFKNNPLETCQLLDAANIILGSISKFFAGTMIGKASDILKELLELTKCLFNDDK